VENRSAAPIRKFREAQRPKCPSPSSKWTDDQAYYSP